MHYSALPCAVWGRWKSCHKVFELHTFDLSDYIPSVSLVYGILNYLYSCHVLDPFCLLYFTFQNSIENASGILSASKKTLVIFPYLNYIIPITELSIHHLLNCMCLCTLVMQVLCVVVYLVECWLGPWFSKAVKYTVSLAEKYHVKMAPVSFCLLHLSNRST